MTDLDSLISKFQNKDEIAFETLYNMYSSSIQGFILNIVKDSKLADEITQDVFFKAWINSKSYDSEKGRFFTWLLSIARNAAIDKTRSKAFKQSHQNLDVNTFENIISSHDNLNNRTDAIGIKDLLKKLTPKRLKIIELIYFKGLTQQEVSEHLDIPLGTVKTRSRDSINQLRNLVL